MRPRNCLLAAAAALALVVTGCGGDDGVDSDDPAALAPADAPVYIGAVIRPQGSLKTDVEKLASTISGEADPAGRLVELLDEGLAESDTVSGKELTYAKDIEPWLGENAGIFIEGFEGDLPAAGIVQTTDPDAAQQFIDDAREKNDKQRSYEDVDYILDDDTAVGIVDDFLVLGDEPALKRAVDVSGGDDALAEQSDFTSTLTEAPSNSLGDVYVSLQTVAQKLRADDPGNAKALEASIGDLSGKTALASVIPAADSIELDLITNAGQNFQLSDVSSLIDTFPADSFAAVGVPDLGDRVGEVIDQIEKAGVPGVSKEVIDRQLSAMGLSLDNITGALGDLGVFATGTDRNSVQGAGVIASEDPAAAKQLIGRLSDLALRSDDGTISRAPQGTGFTVRDPEDLGPQTLTVTVAGDRIVIGYGQEATGQGLSPRSPTLAEDPTYRRAVGALGGDGLSGYVALAPVFRLAESLGARTDPDYQQARPYLQALSYAVIGAGTQGDFSNTKVIVGVDR